MNSFTCTNINKNSENKVISYELQDSAGKTIQVSSKKLKLMLESNKIEVVNLTIKSNEIIEDSDYQVKVMIAKLKMFGGIGEITHKSDCGHEYYIIKNPDTTIVYIPDDVKYLVKPDIVCGKPDFCNMNCKTLKVIGGSGLTSTYNMFYECEAQSLDLSLFDTSSVTNMRQMFEDCKTQFIDLSSFDTSKVTYMGSMFYYCEAQSIDISSLDTSNVKDMGCMFYECKAQSLDLSSFNTSNVIDMYGMFWCCQATSIDLSSFDTSKVKNMRWMFECCKAKSLDLSSFNTSNVIDMYNMFFKCKAQVKATDKRILEESHNR